MDDVDRKEIARLLEEHRTLRAWLRANGSHAFGCLCAAMRERDAVCTCGWTRVREALNAEGPAVPALDAHLRAALDMIARCAEARHNEVDPVIPEGAAGRDQAFRACETWGAALRFIAHHARAALASVGDAPPADADVFAIVAAARAYHTAYLAECAVIDSDADGEAWVAAITAAHAARQEAEDALFATLDRAGKPPDTTTP